MGVRERGRSVREKTEAGRDSSSEHGVSLEGKLGALGPLKAHVSPAPQHGRTSRLPLQSSILLFFSKL